MLKFVWDTSTLLNLREPDENGYSPAYSFWKDLEDRLLGRDYQNIIPAMSYFEWQASISRKHREGKVVLRELYIMGDHEVLYPIDEKLIRRSNQISSSSGFDKLRGADLIFACIAYVESATLVTLDGDFKKVSDKIHVLNLSESLCGPKYLEFLDSV